MQAHAPSPAEPTAEPAAGARAVGGRSGAPDVRDAPTGALDTRIRLETPEHVALPFALAGPAPRALAYVADLVVRGLVLWGLFLVLTAVTGPLDLATAGVGVGYLAWFLLDWGWHAAFEALDGGRTPGKRMAGLRVVRADGGPIGPREAVLRNLLRAADALPVGYVVGTLACLADPRFRRLGDLVAGTLVVHDGRDPAPLPPVDIVPPVRDAERPRLPRHRRVGPEDHRALEELLLANERLGLVWGEWVAGRVADRFTERYQVRGPTALRTLQLLAAAARAEAPEVERAARSGRDDARALEAILAGGPTRVTTAEAPELVARFRNLVGELGRLRAGASARAHEAEALALSAHGVLYRDAPRGGGAGPRALRTLLLDEFPAALRANARWLLLSTALFVVPLALGAWGAWSDPRFADAVIPREQQELLGEAFREATPRTPEENAAMAGFYVENNVGIALRAAAGGVLGGVVTAWTLVFNGLSIGAFAGWIAREGALGNFLRFVSGHSAWELTAVVVAGTAGLRLGAALLVPGGRTRAASLREAGPDVLRLALGSAAMLAVAATIEGFWSANELPDPVRITFALVQVVLVAAWLGGARRRR